MHDTTTASAELRLIVQSRASVQVNRRLLTATRHLLATSRRRLNPAFAITGASDDSYDAVRAAVRARLASGALFLVGPEVMAGNGSGSPCVICREPISWADVEYEIPLGERIAVVAHATCYAVWYEESEAWTMRQSA